MARPRKTDSEELVRLVDAYFSTEAAGDPTLLKCSLLEEYAGKAGCGAKAYDFRRDKQVRVRMDELREMAAKEKAPAAGKGYVYKSLDINRILGIRRDPDELAKILGEIDNGWRQVYEKAVRTDGLVMEFQLQASKLKEEKASISIELGEFVEQNKRLRKEARNLTAENRYLRKMLKTYLYPALANEILVQENQIENPDTKVTEKAKAELIDGNRPSGVSSAIRRDVSEIKNVDEAITAMWEEIGG